MTSRTLSAGRALLLGFLTLAALCGGLLGWGAFASLSGAVIAVGEVEVKGGVSAVEHVDGGTVAGILARDGDRVAKGAVLVRIDGALLRSEASVLEAELFDLVARRNRLEAEFEAADAIAWDAALEAAADADPAIAAAVDGHRRLFEARRATRDGLASRIRERIGQTRRQIAGLEAQERAIARQIGLIAEELRVQHKLRDSGLALRSTILEFEREMASLEGRAGEIAALIAAAQGRIAEFETQLLQVESRRIEDAESEAREVQARETAVRERLAGLDTRLGRLDVRAPVAGIVHDLAVSAAGEVLQPGEPVARVVPDAAEFTARVRLDPVHVDQVRPGQDALLRFPAFSARNTPEYDGTVARVSADALRDERTGLSWYEVDLAIGTPARPDPDAGPGAWLAAAKAATARLLGSDPGGLPSPGRARDLSPEAALALAPGMPVEAHLRTGDRTPLSYLVKPLADYLQRSMREE